MTFSIEIAKSDMRIGKNQLIVKYSTDTSSVFAKKHELLRCFILIGCHLFHILSINVRRLLAVPNAHLLKFRIRQIKFK